MARRVNKKFIVGMAIGVVVLGVGFFAVTRLFRQSAEQLEKMGDQFFAEQRYAEADVQYRAASGRDPRSTRLLIKRGDTYRQMTRQDPEYIGRARQVWLRAVEIDPACLPALQRLMSMNMEETQVFGARAPEAFKGLEETARKISEVDPSDETAAAFAHIAPVNAWLQGASTATDVDAHVKALTEMLDKYPQNAEIRVALAQVKIKQAEDSAARDKPADAAKAFTEASAIFDSALADESASPFMWYRGGQISLTAVESMRRLGGAEKFGPTFEKIATEGKKRLARASETAKPDDPQFAEIKMTAAQVASSTGDREKAEKILRDLLALRPGDSLVRMQLAEILGKDPAKRPEAIQLLAMTNRDEGVAGMAQVRRANLQIAAQLQLADLRMDEYEAAAATAKGDPATLILAEDSIKRAENAFGETPEVLLQKGRLQLLRGQRIEAIQTLVRGSSLMRQQGRVNDGLNLLLARAYIDARQTGEARRLLSEVVLRQERHWPARLQLAQLLLREGRVDEAKRQLDELEKLVPNEPDVIRLRLASLDLSMPAEKERATKLYAQLPEDTVVAILSKSQLAAPVIGPNEVRRLLTLAVEKEPTNPRAVVSLAQFYAVGGDKEAAKKVVEQAKAAGAEPGQFSILSQVLEDSSPEAIARLREEQIDQISDPFDQKLERAQLRLTQNKPEEALALLGEAQKLKPDDGRLLARLFDYYLQQRQFDKAEELLPKLSTANQDLAGGDLYRFALAKARGDRGQALQIARRLNANQPEFAHSWVAMGQAMQMNDRPEDALEQYAQALQKQPDNADALRGSAACAYAIGKPDDALRFIELGLQRFRNGPEWQEMLLNHWLNYGQAPRVVSAREAALSREPENPAAWINLANAYVRSAQVRAQENKKDQAVEFASKAKDLMLKAVKKWPDDARFYGILTDVYALTGDIAEAEKLLNSLAERPDWKTRPEPALALFDLHRRTGKIDAAEADLRQALSKAPDNLELKSRLASFLAQRGKLDDALAVLPSDASNLNLLRQRIELLSQANRLDKALDEVDAALKSRPQDADLLNLKGFVQLNLGMNAPAQTTLALAIRLAPNSPDPMFQMARAKMMQPRPSPDEAIRLLRTAQENGASSVEVRLLLAQAYQAKNDLDSAAREMRGALASNPQSKDLRLRLIDLTMRLKPTPWQQVESLLAEVLNDPRQQKDPDWHRAAARMWAGRRDGEKAVAEMNKALELSNNNVRMVQEALGVLLDVGRYQNVIDLTNQLLTNEQLKQQPWVFQARAMARRGLGDKEAAMREFEAALNAATALKNDDAAQSVLTTMARELGFDAALSRIGERAQTENRWRLFAAYLYYAKGDSANAVNHIDQVMGDFSKLSPFEQEQALRLAGNVYLIAQPPQPQKARDACQRLLARIPDDVQTLNNMACLLAEQIKPPQPAEALVLAQRAQDAMRSTGVINYLVMDTYGWTLILNNRLDEGIAVLQEVVQKEPFVDAYYHLGEGFLAKGYPEEAQKQLQKAVDLMDKAGKRGSATDHPLRSRIEQAMTRAQTMIKEKVQAKVEAR